MSECVFTSLVPISVMQPGQMSFAAQIADSSGCAVCLQTLMLLSLLLLLMVLQVLTIAAQRYYAAHGCGLPLLHTQR